MTSSGSPSDQAISELVTAGEACNILGIKPASLYTYASRGLLHPITIPGKKSSRYLRDEVDRLRARSEARGGHNAVDASAMRWGKPVIATSVTEITDAGPRYRGYLATDLVRHPGQFENVAELLWSGVLPDDTHNWVANPMRADIGRALVGMGIEMNDQIRMMRVFAVAATALGGGSLAEEVRSGSISRYSREMILAFAGCCGVLGAEHRFIEPEGDKSVAEHILVALRCDATPEVVHAMNAALIIAADHEMASPTFAARIAASAGAGLHACVVAALATQTGALLAVGCDRAEDVLRSLGNAAHVKERIADAQRRGARLPGFGLPLYPRGDPRASCLIDLARSHPRQTRQTELAFQYLEMAQAQLRAYPNIESGLGLLCLVHGLPARAASAIWGIGRSAGWIAHILEQRLAGFAMRPRGHYQP